MTLGLDGSKMMRSNKTDLRQNMLELWYLRAMRSAVQHYHSTHLFRVLDSIFMSVNIIASISVLYLSAVPWFVDTSGHQSIVYLSVAALTTVITSVLHYVFDYRSRWKENELALTGYAILSREIECAMMLEEITDECLRGIKEKFDNLSEKMPTPSRLFWNRPKTISAQIIRLTGTIRERERAN